MVATLLVIHPVARADDLLLQVLPAEVILDGNFERAQLLVSRKDNAGQFSDRSLDATHEAKYVSANPEIVTVDEQGQLLAQSNGEAIVQVQVGSWQGEVKVTAKNVVAEPAVRFMKQVRPVISKAGCNMGACHASQYGKGGFKLSVFGFEPSQDWQGIVRDRLQRRIDFVRPENSLVLLKPTMQVPHQGGLRLKKGSIDYQLLVAWIESGVAKPDSKALEVTELKVIPHHRVAQVDETQQLRVMATYADGEVRDVTALAIFDSMDEGLMAVDRNGRVTILGQGQAPVMVRFEGQATISTFVIPYGKPTQLADWKSKNYVDEAAAAKFRELGLEPSTVCNDSTFVRRAFLDAIGSLPTIEETTRFLDSKDPEKREKLVDQLLGLTGDPKLDIYGDRYASYWTLKWSDLIRNSTDNLGEQGMWALHNWIRESMRTNKPFDQFVQELVTAKGSIYMNGPANYFRINSKTDALTEATSQLFLGIRLECAKCHHHPFEEYSQADYYGLSAFFSRVGLKGSQEFGLFGREQVVVVKSSGDVKHPRTGKTLLPTPLGGEPEDHALDRRIPLAKWLTSKENTWFARAVTNRYVGYLLGRGLVHPVDDLRSTNPASNVALMEALSADLVKHDFNLKHLVRTIMVSRLYQLDSAPTKANASDRRFYSHFRVKRLAAEPLLDAIDQVTGVQTKFKNLPLGTRAIDLPDTNYPNYFLRTFGKPKRVSVCECERSPDENLAQALHTLNGDTIAKKITDKNGRLAKLLEAKKAHAEIVDEIFLATLCRRATEQEHKACQEIVEQGENPLEGFQDVMWAVLNLKQFIFVH
ncbi:MAG: DUF1549 and DUF1553 domain-containing protein [Planctomycetota bacterium]|nr:DUF1549 and DUF1553 domain-containing protein [Planctomycetota bacterium]